MKNASYLPVFELTRGNTVESIHYGAIAVVDAQGRLYASYGDPEAITYLRSTAKPFQVLPFVESGGPLSLQLSPKEIALMCASHAGTDEHVQTVLGIQRKAGITEGDLLCGIHPPGDEKTAAALAARGEEPTPNRHNCSGKHSGMLAFARFSGWSIDNYIDPQHPVQERILQTFAEMCDLPPSKVAAGIDGCSAPNFAVPLRSAALAFARLSDPIGLPEKRKQACQTIFSAMTAHPEMVGGPGRFDTRLMQVAGGKIVSKAGAEGYQGFGLLPGALGKDSPALGIAYKLSDGDLRGRARPAVGLEVLRQLGALNEDQLAVLADLGPTLSLYNYRKIPAGQARPAFKLQFTSQTIPMVL